MMFLDAYFPFVIKTRDCLVKFIARSIDHMTDWTLKFEGTESCFRQPLFYLRGTRKVETRHNFNLSSELFC